MKKKPEGNQDKAINVESLKLDLKTAILAAIIIVSAVGTHFSLTGEFDKKIQRNTEVLKLDHAAVTRIEEIVKNNATDIDDIKALVHKEIRQLDKRVSIVEKSVEYLEKE